MFSAILIILVMPFTDLSRSRGLQFRPLSKIAFYIFLANFLILMQLGAKHVESPFISFSKPLSKLSRFFSLQNSKISLEQFYDSSFIP